MIVYFTIFLIVYFTADALHYKYFLSARQIVYNRESDRMWHKIDSIIKIGVSILVLYLMGLETIFGFILYGIYFMALRALWFNLMLNLFRGIELFHLSDYGIEGFIKEKFGATVYWMCSVFSVLLILTIIILKTGGL
jgi:hypothetical protein